MSFWGDLFGLTPQKSRPTAAAVLKAGNSEVILTENIKKELSRVYDHEPLLRDSNGTDVALYVDDFEFSNNGNKVTLKMAEMRKRGAAPCSLEKAQGLFYRDFPGIFTVRCPERSVIVDFEASANTAALLKALGKLPNHHSQNNGSGKVRSGAPTVKGNSR